MFDMCFFGFSAYKGSELENQCPKLNISFGAMVPSSADKWNTPWLQRKIGFITIIFMQMYQFLAINQTCFFVARA